MKVTLQETGGTTTTKDDEYMVDSAFQLNYETP